MSALCVPVLYQNLTCWWEASAAEFLAVTLLLEIEKLLLQYKNKLIKKINEHVFIATTPQLTPSNSSPLVVSAGSQLPSCLRSCTVRDPFHMNGQTVDKLYNNINSNRLSSFITVFHQVYKMKDSSILHLFRDMYVGSWLTSTVAPQHSRYFLPDHTRFIVIKRLWVGGMGGQLTCIPSSSWWGTTVSRAGWSIRGTRQPGVPKACSSTICITSSLIADWHRENQFASVPHSHPCGCPGVHEAGFSNAILLPPHALLVEIAGSFDHRISPTSCGFFGPISAAFGVHHYIFCFYFPGRPVQDWYLLILRSKYKERWRFPRQVIQLSSNDSGTPKYVVFKPPLVSHIPTASTRSISAWLWYAYSSFVWFDITSVLFSPSILI